MASVEQTVRNALLDYPTIFSRPFDVFHHLFLVLGNGFHWENGELVDRSTSYPVDEAKIVAGERDKFAASARSAKDLHGDSDRVLAIELEAARYDFTVANLDRIVALSTGPGEGPTGLYPYSGSHVGIYAIPPDAKEDWLEAIDVFIGHALRIIKSREREGGGDASHQASDQAYLDALPKARQSARDMLAARARIEGADAGKPVVGFSFGSSM